MRSSDKVEAHPSATYKPVSHSHLSNTDTKSSLVVKAHQSHVSKIPVTFFDALTFLTASVSLLLWASDCCLPPLATVQSI